MRNVITQVLNLEVMVELTIGHFLCYLSPQLFPWGHIVDPAKKLEIPVWPADVFAVCAAIVEKSVAAGALGVKYCPWTGQPNDIDARENWIKKVRKTAKKWQSTWIIGKVPEGSSTQLDVKSYWNDITGPTGRAIA